jgi:hypothetical protein
VQITETGQWCNACLQAIRSRAVLSAVENIADAA